WCSADRCATGDPGLAWSATRLPASSVRRMACRRATRARTRLHAPDRVAIDAGGSERPLRLAVIATGARERSASVAGCAPLAIAMRQGAALSRMTPVLSRFGVALFALLLVSAGVVWWLNVRGEAPIEEQQPDPAYTSEEIQRGASLARAGNCSACHTD